MGSGWASASGVGVGVAATLSLTVAPLERRSPAAGDCEPTLLPGGASAGLTTTLKPAASSVFVASSTVAPLTSGICGRALATVRVTVAPLSTRVPVTGSCFMTVPAGCVVSCSTTLGVSPAALSCCSAASRCSPTTFGTATPSAPCETVNVTVACLVSEVPASGSVEITSPDATVSENACLTLTAKPAARTASSASACDLPTTAGTGALPRPEETVSVTVEPFLTRAPAAGSCESTSSRGALSSVTALNATSRPRRCSASEASPALSPVTLGTSTRVPASRR